MTLAPSPVRIKICRGCGPLPRTHEHFVCRIRKGHSDDWGQYCRKCKRLRLDRKPKVAP